jgi:hypothetical protein
LQIPTSTCSASSYAFVNNTPSIISIASASTSAIISSVFNGSGLGIVTITDNSVVIYTYYITVTGFTNGIDDFVYSTSTIAGPTTGSINNISSIPIINNSSNVFFVFLEATIQSLNIQYSYYSPGSSPTIKFGNVSTATNVSAQILVLKNFPSSSLLNNLPICGSSVQSLQSTILQYIQIPTFPCISTNMLCFIQFGASTSGVILSSSIISPSTIAAQLSTTSGLSSTLVFSYFLVTKGYLNVYASSGLFYTDLINVTFSSTGTSTVSVTINSIFSSLTSSNYVFFFQIQSAASTVIINNYLFGSGNTIALSYTATATGTFPVGVICFVKQSIGSITLS